MIEIEQAIYDAFRVRDVADPELASGDWFSAEVMEMAYGVQAFGPEPRGAAIFTARMPELCLLLSGSAEYLLDRSVPEAYVTGGASDPQSIWKMLQLVTEDSTPCDPAHASDNSSQFASSAAAKLYKEFSVFGLQPLRFLARAMMTKSRTRYSSASILGTPLFVEFAQRD